MRISEHENYIKLSEIGDINLELTLDCGQAFRWEKLEDNSFFGISSGKETRVKKEGSSLLFFNTSKDDIENFWADYFDLNRDYEKILERLCEDEKIKKTVDLYGTVRLLNQDPWETLCSFIISACNNIPRIKNIVRTLCENFGEKTPGGFAFPSYAVLAGLSEKDLDILHAGYRVPYILDAAKKINSGEINFDKIKTYDENTARNELMKIKGVGKKVADCTLLFSLGFKDVYPVDRHIARAEATLYPDGLPECFSSNRGLAQQYMFHYQRTTNK